LNPFGQTPNQQSKNQTKQGKKEEKKREREREIAQKQVRKKTSLPMTLLISSSMQQHCCFFQNLKTTHFTRSHK